MTFSFSLLDVLIFASIVGILVISFSLLWLIIKVRQTLTRVNQILDDVEDTTSDIRNVKNKIKNIMADRVSSFFNKFQKRR